LLFIDEDTMKNPLKEIDKLDFTLPKILTKELYKLQVSVVQEIQSRERYDMKNLWIEHEDNTIIKEFISQ
jgi:hypothetical protein